MAIRHEDITPGYYWAYYTEKLGIKFPLEIVAVEEITGAVNILQVREFACDTILGDPLDHWTFVKRIERPFYVVS